MSAAGLTDAVARRFEAVIGRHASETEPGIAFAILQGNDVLFQRCLGLGDVECARGIHGRTRFRIASITKTFCAMLTAMLADEGVFSLNDPVRSLVPELHPFEPPVSIAHLLTMTSGLREELALAQMAVGYEGRWNWSRADLLGLILAQTTQTFPSGSEQIYCNSNYTVLELLIRRATGAVLNDLLQQRIFAPLGMHDTAVVTEYVLSGPEAAHGYVNRGAGFERASCHSEMGAAGGAVSTLEDMLAFCRCIRTTATPLGTVFGRLTQPVTLTDGTSVGYRYGVERRSYAGRTTIGHSGGLPGYASEYVRFPESDVSVVILANRADTNWHERAREVVLAAIDPAVDPPTRRLRPNPDVSWSDEFGDERSGRAMRIERVDGALRCDGRVFFEVDRCSFVKDNSGELVTLPRGVSAPPNRIDYSVGGRTYRLRRRSVRELAPEQLDEYAGTYYCKELPGTHRIALVGGTLVATIGQGFPSGGRRPLVPVHSDFFRAFDDATGDPIETTFAFRRDKNRRVFEVTLGQSRLAKYTLRRIAGATPPRYETLAYDLKGTF